MSEFVLSGQTILVTRPRGQGELLAQQLEVHGARVVHQPVLKICEPANWAPADAAMEQIHEFDWLVFTSANGVRCFAERLIRRGLDVQTLVGFKIAAVGPATARSLTELNLHPDVAPSEHRSEALAAELGRQAVGQRILLVRGEEGRDLLRQQLSTCAAVTSIAVYRQQRVRTIDRAIASALDRGEVNWITLTSGNIVRALASLISDTARDHIWSGRTRLATISPLTSAVAKEHGWPVAAEAGRYTDAGLVDAMIAAG